MELSAAFFRFLASDNGDTGIMPDFHIPIPTATESIERYTVRAHQALLQAVPNPDERNALVWETWAKHRGQTDVEREAARCFDADRYAVESGVCVFAEHETVGRDGKPRKYSVRELAAIARTNNRLAADRSMFAALSDGHTPDDPNGPKPRVLGWAGNVRLGMIGRQRPVWALFTDEYRAREALPDFSQRPARSVELLTVPGVGRYFYPIAALSAEAPRLPLPHKYATASMNGVEIERYSYTFQPERYDLTAGAMTQLGANTGYVPSLSNRKRDKHCAGGCGQGGKAKYHAGGSQPASKPAGNPAAGHPFWKMPFKDQLAALKKSTAGIKQTASDIRGMGPIKSTPKFQATALSTGDKSMSDLTHPSGSPLTLDDEGAKRIVAMLFETPLFKKLERMDETGALDKLIGDGSPLGADEPLGSDTEDIPAAEPEEAPGEAAPVAAPPGAGPAAPAPGGPLTPAGEDDLADLIPEAGPGPEGSHAEPDGDETGGAEPHPGAQPPKPKKHKESFAMPQEHVEKYAALLGSHQQLLADFSRAQERLATLEQKDIRAQRMERINGLAKQFPGLVDVDRYAAKYAGEKLPGEAVFDSAMEDLTATVQKAALSSEHITAIMDPGAPPKPEKYTAAQVTQIHRVAMQLHGEEVRVHPQSAKTYDDYKAAAIKQLGL